MTLRGEPMLRRKIAAELERWLKSAEQKALFITGSRQIGKSYSIRAFGKASHATYIELNLMENRQAKDALLEARDADDFISRVTLLSGKSIAPGKTLVFIDEVQEAPDIMTMAKFLVEDGRCRWAFSGSMLGTQFKGVRSYPVGYVHELRMFPLDFEEFCWATGVSEGARQTIRDACISERPIPDYIHDAMMANFRTYTVVGGMPEVVQRFLDTQGDLASVRQLQSELNEQYRRDISKYASGRALQVQSIYDQLPIMLEGEHKRFVLNSIDPKAHYEKYQRDFVWLVDAGVALKADIVTEPKSPLLKTARPSQFKLYQSDTGMLMSVDNLPFRARLNAQSGRLSTLVLCRWRGPCARAARVPTAARAWRCNRRAHRGRWHRSCRCTRGRPRRRGDRSNRAGARSCHRGRLPKMRRRPRAFSASI